MDEKKFRAIQRLPRLFVLLVLLSGCHGMESPPSISNEGDRDLLSCDAPPDTATAPNSQRVAKSFVPAQPYVLTGDTVILDNSGTSTGTQGKLATALAQHGYSTQADFERIGKLVIRNGTLSSKDSPVFYDARSGSGMKNLQELEVVGTANFVGNGTRSCYFPDLFPNEDQSGCSLEGAPVSNAASDAEAGVIPKNMFQGHPSLRRITIQNAKQVASSAFSLIPTLQYVNLPDVEILQSQSFAMEKFSDNSQLKEVHLPRLKTSWERTFYYNVNLNKLVLGERPPYFSSPSSKEGLWFSYATQVEIYVPSKASYDAYYLNSAYISQVDFSGFPAHASNGDSITTPPAANAYQDKCFNHLRTQYPGSEQYDGNYKYSLQLYSFNSALNRAINDGKTATGALSDGSPGWGVTNGNQINTYDAMTWAKNKGFDQVDIAFYYLPGYSNTDMPPLNLAASCRPGNLANKPGDCVTQDTIRARIDQLRHWSNAIGIDISGTGIQNSFSDSLKARRDLDLERSKFYLEMTARLGAPMMRIFTGPPPVQISRVSWKDIMDSQVIPMARELAQYGIDRNLRDKHGNYVMISVQNHGDMLSTANQVLYFYSQMKDSSGKQYPNVRMINDTGYYRPFNSIDSSQTNWYDEIATASPVGASLQIKKKPGGAETSTMMDLPRLFAGVRSKGFGSFQTPNYQYNTVQIEVLWAPGDADNPENISDKTKVMGAYYDRVMEYTRAVWASGGKQ
ncbi:hypothetical protein [Burkholderia sp. S-53]|uniref:hypothetical protein n=1 Tax=Burkholderia sp. S-53 TaxID=2906514 RepID=UPI0021CE04A6|nr:hypothetical protein [Burkholderia sp. S-53]UXU85829.1 hypothetical protein LXM88_00635 [Burkholderia sp. S-53]